MTTTTTFSPITITEIRREDWDGDTVAEGQHVSFGAMGFVQRHFDPLEDYHPAFGEWDKLSEEVFEEVHGKIADLFYEAIQRRLPWTWEPER